MGGGDDAGGAIGAEEPGGGRIARATVFPEPVGDCGEVGRGTRNRRLRGDDLRLQLSDFRLALPLFRQQRVRTPGGGLRARHRPVMFRLQSAERSGPGPQYRGWNAFRDIRSFTDGSHADDPFVMSAGWKQSRRLRHRLSRCTVREVTAA